MHERYGPMTHGMMLKVMKACNVDRSPWAQLYAYLACRFTNEARLGETEAQWLSEWKSGRDEALRGQAITVQTSTGQIARELFDGQKTTASRALRTLEDKGLLTLIRKGRKGHGSLYLAGILEYTNQAENVYQSESELVHKNPELVHISGELVHIQDLATCGNDVTFKSYSNNAKKGEALSDEFGICPKCGVPRVEEGPYLVRCPKCGRASTKKKPGKGKGGPR